MTDQLPTPSGFAAMPGSATYPPEWKQIATRIKDAAAWTCERCKHPHDVPSGHVLTVHHLDGNKANCEDWNLAALCQRCHLTIQGKVSMFQEYAFEHTAWMVPHVAGRDKAIAEGRWPK